jgi:beta-ureidopropionase / N-carbamoyl-L-amino-acid hydrolase
MNPPGLAERFELVWSELGAIGRSPAGGFDRFAWTGAGLRLRDWFHGAAAARAMDVEQDRNGNLWAWWGRAGRESAGSSAAAVVTGSHLDSVPGGGAFDGPLGVLGGFLAVDELRSGPDGQDGPPPRPVAVACFTEEEGGRFGVACLGSRLMTGDIAPGRALALTDASGTTLAEAMRRAGADPARLGTDEARLPAIGAYVELHIEQGRRLADLGAPVGVGTGIWPHGRWRIGFDGEANHAGTTWLDDRHDPMLPFAATVAEARAAAAAHHGLATIGRAEINPNATNAVAASVRAWLDARAPDTPSLRRIVADVRAAADRIAAGHGVRVAIDEESVTELVTFDPALRERIGSLLGGPPEIPTGAGHDSGILAARVPTAMLFVRNPTGISHSPAEDASRQDCLAGVRALAAVLKDLAWD